VTGVSAAQPSPGMARLVLPQAAGEAGYERLNPDPQSCY
jgi:hypothetical protein